MAITREELVGELLRRVSVSRERREETVEKMVLTGGVHLAVREREEEEYRFGRGGRWAAGCF
jgi:hypothetical protein